MLDKRRVCEGFYLAHAVGGSFNVTELYVDGEGIEPYIETTELLEILSRSDTMEVFLSNDIILLADRITGIYWQYLHEEA